MKEIPTSERFLNFRESRVLFFKLLPFVVVLVMVVVYGYICSCVYECMHAFVYASVLARGQQLSSSVAVHLCF